MNNNKRDLRLWKESKFQDQAIQFWKDLAQRLKGHPAIVGFNIVNEPHPELAHGKHSFWDGKLAQWYETVKGSEGDLNLFYDKVIKAIRSVDSDTPIVIESGLFGTPWAFDYLEPIKDENIIYSFHMYEPYEYTTKRINEGKYSYPSQMPIEDLGEPFLLNRGGLINFLKPIDKWSTKNQIPSNRIWVGEFGGNRHVKGIDFYIKDLISIFNEKEWHWSFYSYREDTWEGMDYELGTQKVHYKYWEYQEANTLHLNYSNLYDRVKGNDLWKIISYEFE